MIHDYIISYLTYVLIYSIVVMALNISWGFTGLVNLGHMVFFGIGAYASALLTLNGIPWYLAMPIAGILAALIGVIIAAITVRLKGDYFQIATLGLIFIAITLSRNWISLTRGALGLPGVPPILRNSFYYMLFVLAAAVICAVFFYWITNSETGKIFQAIRDDETAASILGKNTYFYKVISIAISTFFAGIAGSLLAHYIQFVDPSYFDLEFFVLMIAMLIAGGLASIKGSIIGAFAVGAFTEIVKFIFTNVSPELIGALRQMLLMAIIIVLLIYRPRGMFGRVDV